MHIRGMRGVWEHSPLCNMICTSRLQTSLWLAACCWPGQVRRMHVIIPPHVGSYMKPHLSSSWAHRFGTSATPYTFSAAFPNNDMPDPTLELSPRDQAIKERIVQMRAELDKEPGQTELKERLDRLLQNIAAFLPLAREIRRRTFLEYACHIIKVGTREEWLGRVRVPKRVEKSRFQMWASQYPNSQVSVMVYDKLLSDLRRTESPCIIKIDTRLVRRVANSRVSTHYLEKDQANLPDVAEAIDGMIGIDKGLDQQFYEALFFQIFGKTTEELQDVKYEELVLSLDERYTGRSL